MHSLTHEPHTTAKSHDLPQEAPENHRHSTAAHDRGFVDKAPGILRCLLPVNFDVDALCAALPDAVRWPSKHRYRLAYVVHTIIVGNHFRHALDDKDVTRGVPLKMEVLRSLFGKGKRDFAKEAIGTLVDQSIIERAGNHRAGFRSRCYRLAPAYQQAPVLWRSFAAPKIVAKRETRRQKKSAEHKAVAPEFTFISDNLAAVSVSASGQTAAKCYLATMADPKKQAAWLNSLEQLETPSAQFTYSEKTGRVYHAVSHCPKELRQHLLIDGEPTAEVDISASQFFLLLGLYAEPSAEKNFFGQPRRRMEAPLRTPPPARTTKKLVEALSTKLLDFDAQGGFRLRDLPEELKQQIRTRLTERRVVQHIPRDMNGLRVEENTRGILKRENGRVFLRQQKRDADGKRIVNETDEPEGKVIGLPPLGQSSGKLAKLNGVRVIADNFGVAILEDGKLRLKNA